jgi:ABC-type multidrug transport system fused ATPase/permease subunit
MRPLSKVLDLLGGRLAAVAGLLALLVLGAFLEAAGVGLLVPFIALVANPDPARLPVLARRLLEILGASDPARTAVTAGLALLAVNWTKNVYMAVLARIQFRFLYRAQSVLSCRLFARYMKESFAAHLQRHSSEALRTINTDVFAVFDYVLVPTFVLATEACVLAALTGVLLLAAPVQAVAAVAVLGAASVALYAKLRASLKGVAARQQDELGAMFRWVQQGLGAFKEAKVLGREEFFTDAYARHRSEYADCVERKHAALELPRLFVESLFVGGIVLAVVFTARRGGDLGAVLPTLALFTAASVRLMPAVNRVLSSATTIRANWSFVEALHGKLAEMEPAAPPAKVVAAMPFSRDVELRGVSYSYPGGRGPALGGVTLRVGKGQSVALVGPSGAGKSTAVDLLMGLLSPAEGSLLVDGKDAAGDLPSWRANLGVVPQPVFLYDDTIRRNVAFGLEDAEISEERVWAALRAAQLETVVRALPEGLETRLGEGGARLSGGQRQRVGIARALYRDPAVLLLDEAATGLDNETEAEVNRAVTALSGTRTLVIVAHRLDTVRRCDRVYLLKAGKVAAEGTYDELMSASEEFRALVAAGERA